jgi:PqqD family protein of HPr-rel-A system
MEVHWQVTDPNAILWEAWESEYSLFDRNSGETHLISELPAEVLRRLGDAPVAEGVLVRSLAADCEVDCTPQWRTKIREILENLHTLGLIDQVHA